MYLRAVDENTVTIRGEHRDEQRKTDPTTGRIYRTERSRRSFTRSFALPPGADPNNVGEYLLLYTCNHRL